MTSPIITARVDTPAAAAPPVVGLLVLGFGVLLVLGFVVFGFAVVGVVVFVVGVILVAAGVGAGSYSPYAGGGLYSPYGFCPVTLGQKIVLLRTP